MCFGISQQRGAWLGALTSTVSTTLPSKVTRSPFSTCISFDASFATLDDTNIKANKTTISTAAPLRYRHRFLIDPSFLSKLRTSPSSSAWPMVTCKQKQIQNSASECGPTQGAANVTHTRSVRRAFCIFQRRPDIISTHLAHSFLLVRGARRNATLATRRICSICGDDSAAIVRHLGSADICQIVSEFPTTCKNKRQTRCEARQRLRKDGCKRQSIPQKENQKRSVWVVFITDWTRTSTREQLAF